MLHHLLSLFAWFVIQPSALLMDTGRSSVEAGIFGERHFLFGSLL
jgi:hypothetical protein